MDAADLDDVDAQSDASGRGGDQTDCLGLDCLLHGRPHRLPASIVTDLVGKSVQWLCW